MSTAFLKNIFALSYEHKTQIERFLRDFKDFIQWDALKDQSEPPSEDAVTIL